MKLSYSGLVLNHRLVFNAHVQYIMRQCAQRFYLMKLLRKQGLPHRQLSIVFQAIIVSRVHMLFQLGEGFLLLILYSKLMLFSFEHAKMVSAMTSFIC
jgi:hypothetical protein